eukprot:CAMPEP_0201513130 /NCGR_PEP_ID=MMETSP0161_2-20130828/5240_1 /ASSEMBLY_ACC=CAM_ASM_000251 /TAXON_ID=180227 /ORGANISM="Neoparamoeba aestuarina, Strain SoJaBio B1-5/56/2" /LENGTH=63 /DNA_ID=CAMNT_0047909219 /DNA_START=287 /DNA_END=474 /DNA_ORIENTATION=+
MGIEGILSGFGKVLFEHISDGSIEKRKAPANSAFSVRFEVGIHQVIGIDNALIWTGDIHKKLG